jgi:hypothetical protein
MRVWVKNDSPPCGQFSVSLPSQLVVYFEPICLRSISHTRECIIFFSILRLFPILDPDYVANEIVTAIRSRDKVLIIPSYLRIFLALKL